MDTMRSGGILKISKDGSIFRKYWVKELNVRGTLDEHEIKIDATIVESNPEDGANGMQIQLDLPRYKLIEDVRG